MTILKDDKFARMNQDLDETQEIMQKNVMNMQQNLLKADEVAGETDSLLAHSKDFKNQATNLKRTMWWKNMKLWLMFGAIALIIIVIIIIIICVSLPDSEE